MSPYTMQALQDLADDGVHLLEVDDAGLLATVAECENLRARVAELRAAWAKENASAAGFLRRAERAEADAARLREALRKWERVVRDFRAGFGSSRNADDADNTLLAFAAALASAPSAEPEAPDYSGLCSAPACGGHCGYVHAVGCEAIREYLADHGGAPYKAPSRAPSASPTPRDMRVATKPDMATLRMALRKMHRRACGDESAVYMSIPADRERDADLLLEDALDELAAYRALAPSPRDLAAVVAKVVGT